MLMSRHTLARTLKGARLLSSQIGSINKRKCPATLSADCNENLCFIFYAVLKALPFKVNKLKINLPNKLLMANEYLAFYVALAIIESYKRNDVIEGLSHILNGFDCLTLPKTYRAENEDDSRKIYIDNVCKALYYVENADNFDVFSYANILFLLEKRDNTIKN